MSVLLGVRIHPIPVEVQADYLIGDKLIAVRHVFKERDDRYYFKNEIGEEVCLEGPEFLEELGPLAVVESLDGLPFFPQALD